MQARARRPNALTTIASIVLLSSGAALAQFGFARSDAAYRPLPNLAYDGRFTFVRVRYAPAPGGWEPFADTRRRVLPDVQFLDIEAADPVFHSFFEINGIDHFPQAYVR
jgi:hypothetical protein